MERDGTRFGHNTILPKEAIMHTRTRLVRMALAAVFVSGALLGVPTATRDAKPVAQLCPGCRTCPVIGAEARAVC